MNVKLISLSFFTISSLYYNDSILHLNGVLKLDELLLACENIRFSSLFVAVDVSREGTSATQ